MHSCPDCGSACYCGGDVDDIDTGDEEAEDNCTHCAEGDGGDDDEIFEPDYLDDPRAGDWSETYED